MENRLKIINTSYKIGANFRLILHQQVTEPIFITYINLLSDSKMLKNINLIDIKIISTKKIVLILKKKVKVTADCSKNVHRPIEFAFI